MVSRGFTLWFTRPPGAIVTTIIQLTADQLKRRGYEVETDDEIARLICKPETLAGTGHDIQAIVEVEIREPNDGARKDESSSVVEADSAPERLKITVESDLNSPEQSVAHLLSKLADMELLPRLTSQDDSYDAEAEAIIRSRLESLGYL